MSDPMTDGPTEEEMRAYLESLRAAQPVEIIVQSFGIMATAAEVKLGQPDARVLIDGMGALLDATAGSMPGEIVDRMRQTIQQLQLAQVRAERAGTGDTTATGEAAPADQAAEQPSGQAPPQQQPEQPRSDAASRLWIPGRD
ncbi:MAG TPA: hypothetical protein VK923_08290 [Euzebyales bacterium]|nr:hypothetical protein [Euzebyales bacterium]